MRSLRQPLAPRSPFKRTLKKARDLAERVQTAERVHQKAEESRRLTEIAKRQSENGRLLAASSHQEAQAIKISIWQSFDTINEAGRLLFGKVRR